MTQEDVAKHFETKLHVIKRYKRDEIKPSIKTAPIRSEAQRLAQ